MGGGGIFLISCSVGEKLFFGGKVGEGQSGGEGEAVEMPNPTLRLPTHLGGTPRNKRMQKARVKNKRKRGLRMGIEKGTGPPQTHT